MITKEDFESLRPGDKLVDDHGRVWPVERTSGEPGNKTVWATCPGYTLEDLRWETINDGKQGITDHEMGLVLEFTTEPAHVLLAGRYTPSFVTAVKAAYPDNQELHQALDTYSSSVGRFLQECVGNSVDLERIIMLLEEGQPDQLLTEALQVRTKKQLYADWLDMPQR